MNTPHSFGEEIDDSEIDASQEQLDLPTTTDDDDFDENTLSMVMGILGLCNIVNIGKNPGLDHANLWQRSCWFVVKIMLVCGLDHADSFQKHDCSWYKL